MVDNACVFMCVYVFSVECVQPAAMRSHDASDMRVRVALPYGFNVFSARVGRLTLNTKQKQQQTWRLHTVNHTVALSRPHTRTPHTDSSVLPSIPPCLSLTASRSASLPYHRTRYRRRSLS